MMDLYISVIVPFLNVAAFIEECAKSLLHQEFSPDAYEVIFVDNGSTDQSRQIAESLPRLRVLSESRRGAYAARNRGIAASTGKILAFTDPDCVPERDWLSTLCKRMEDPSVSVVLGNVTSGTGGVLALIDAYCDQRSKYIYSSSIPQLYVGFTNNMAARRSAFEQTGPFVETLRGSDVLFVRRVIELQNPEAVAYVPEALVRHLEVNALHVWFRKMFIYGQTSGAQKSLLSARTLNAEEQFEIFRQTARCQRYGFRERAILLAVLIFGIGAFRIGRWSRLVFHLSS
jgi:glycosyltransferase involved in cell wall biosynthesis